MFSFQVLLLSAMYLLTFQPDTGVPKLFVETGSVTNFT